MHSFNVYDYHNHDLCFYSGRFQDETSSHSSYDNGYFHKRPDYLFWQSGGPARTIVSYGGSENRAYRDDRPRTRAGDVIVHEERIPAGGRHRSRDRYGARSEYSGASSYHGGERYMSEADSSERSYRSRRHEEYQPYSSHNIVRLPPTLSLTVFNSVDSNSHTRCIV